MFRRLFKSRFRWSLRRGGPRAWRDGAALSGAALLRATFLSVCAIGCRQEMADQPRLEPLEASRFFDDGMGSRDLVPGTVSRGYQPAVVEAPPTPYFLTGLVDGQPASELPPEMLEESDLERVLHRGQERYEIFCSHCHDLVGTGRGMVPQRGFPEPPTFHSQRLRAVPLGIIYRVIRDGHGAMPAHATQIPPADRWAIAAYVRALQLSQHADASLLTPQDLDRLTDVSP